MKGKISLGVHPGWVLAPRKCPGAEPARGQLSHSENFGKKVVKCNILHAGGSTSLGGRPSLLGSVCFSDPHVEEQGATPGPGSYRGPAQLGQPCPPPRGHAACLHEPDLLESVLVLPWHFFLCKALLLSVSLQKILCVLQDSSLRSLT